MVDPQVVLLLWMSLVAGAVFLMFDIARQPQSCRLCQHCQAKDQEQREKQIKMRHDLWHSWHDTGKFNTRDAARDCRDPDCEGIDRRGR